MDCEQTAAIYHRPQQADTIQVEGGGLLYQTRKDKGQMTDQPVIYDSFLATTKAINALDIPDISEKEKAIRFVRAAQNMIRFQLEQRDLEGAKETLDKVGAVEGYYAKKTNGQKKLVDRLSKKYGHQADAPELQRELEKLHQHRIIQNLVAEGRIRSIRDIGDWAIVWVDHGHHKTVGGVDVEEKRAGNADFLAKPDLVKSGDVLSSFLIISRTLRYWMELAGVKDEVFDEFIAAFTDETIRNNLELTYWTAQKAFTKATDSEKNKDINLVPQLRAIYLDLFYLRMHLDQSRSAMQGGDLPPKAQMQTIHDMFRDTVDHINSYMNSSAEMY